METCLLSKDMLHVAIIPDGNGRWATERGQSRASGHRAGISALRRAVKAAPGLGIRMLTFYAFSADNWRRPAAEVAALMALLRGYLRLEVTQLIESGVRLSVIGRRDRLPDGLPGLIQEAEAQTAGGTALHLRLAIDYSARDAILAAAEASGPGPLTRESLSRGLSPDVDLVIRTSGERRLSDFLLWEAAYAELYFTPQYWPDFGAEDFARALRDYAARDRRFGGLPFSPVTAREGLSFSARPG